MSDFKSKMHQIQFRLGLPDPLAGFKGPTSKGREGREGDGGEEGDGMGGKQKEGREGEGEWREGKGERMWRGPESGLPRGPCWLSAGLGGRGRKEGEGRAIKTPPPKWAGYGPAIKYLKF